MPDGRPTIATADNRGSLAIGGLMQFDMGGYFQNPNPQFPQLNDGVNLRRGRTRFRRAKGATEDYFASAYLTGPDFGDQNGALLNGEQVGFVGRLAERPYHDEDWNCMPGCRVRPCSTPTSMQWHTWSKRHHNLSRRPTGAAHRLQQAGLHRHAFRERSECLRRRARYRLA